MNITENLNLHRWAQDMADCKASGLTRKQWCNSRNMSLSTYDYHCKRVRMAFESKLHENNDSATAIVPAESEAVSSCSPVFAKVNLQTSKDVSSGINIKLANRAYHCSGYSRRTCPYGSGGTRLCSVISITKTSTLHVDTRIYAME